jgi:hypothetical protein
MNKRRKQSSLWGELGEYLIGEMTAVLKVLGIILFIMFLVVSLFVGMYHVVIYLFFVIIFGREIEL